MAELQPLAFGGEDHLVLAGDAAAAQRGEADPPRLPRAGRSIAAAIADLGEVDAAPVGRRRAEHQRRAGRRIDLQPVMHLQYLDVPILAEQSRRLAHQVGEEVDAERGVRRLNHRYLCRGFADHPLMIRAKAGRADQDRFSRRDRRGDMLSDRVRYREVDENVGPVLADPDIVAVPDRLGDRLTHPPARAENRDAGHVASHCLSCFMGEVPDIRNIETLSLAAARRIALAAQGYADARPAGPVDQGHLLRLVKRLALHQIDSVNVLARAHYLPAFSRLGAYPRPLLDRMAWGKPRRLFEYWAHEASLLPFDMHPLLRWRMAQAERGERLWGSMKAFAGERRGEAEAVLARIAAEGPHAASDFAGDKGAGGWWGWSGAKAALEYLFWAGRITTATRRGSFERVYDLPQRVLPASVLALPTPTEADARRALIERAARALGIATATDLRDYFRLSPAEAAPPIAELVEAGSLLPVQVEGWRQPAFLHARARRPRKVAAQALIAPFDPLIWERSRTERLFGLRYRIEIYTPADKRVHGYYVLPFLLGDRLAARVDLKADRQAHTLRVQAAHAEPDAPPETAERLAAELRLMADWLGLEKVALANRGDLARRLGPHLRPGITCLDAAPA